MDEPASGGTRPAIVRKPTDQAGILDPSGDLRSAADDCVHCGFCLPACPTYQLWGEEMDSPRGRIHLISQMLDGAQASEAAVSHLDRCLGCMACLPACPSGVRYDRLIEAARTWTEEPQAGAAPMPARTARERAVRAAIFATFPYPRRLRLLARPLRLAQRAGLDRRLRDSPMVRKVAPELAAALQVAPPAARHAPPPEHSPAHWPRRAVVGMLTGCVQQVFFPEVNAATARVLAAEGCDVVTPPGQGCCGALSLHTGRATEAAMFAKRTIAAFEDAGVEVIVVNSAGCGSAMKEYAELLKHDREQGQDWPQRAARAAAKVRDLSEFLSELADGGGGQVAVRHPLPVKAAYHEACHLGNAQGIRRQPRELLRTIPGLDLAEVGDGGTCCGSAGVYNLLQPEAAGELGARKAAAIRATGATLVISANPGCSLQIASALGAPGSVADPGAGAAGPGAAATPAIVHIAEVLDASFRGLSVAELTGGG
jgi:glycolate oxidase iron-sulfur subunit